MPPRPESKLLGDRWRRQARLNPDGIALVCGVESVTYRELDTRVDQLAQWFLREGLRRGDRVAFIWLNEIPAVVIYLACFRAGLVALPVIWRIKAPELAYILDHAGPVLGFTHPKFAAVFVEAQKLGGNSCRLLTALPALAATENFPWPAVEPADPALIIYTSGTTARPKGVTHSHETLGAAVGLMWEIGGSEVAITTTSILHPSGLYCIVLPTLLSGGTVVLVPAFDAAAVLDAIVDRRGTNIFLLPSMAQVLVAEQKQRPRRVASLAWVISGGDTVPVAIHEEFQKVFGVCLREGLAMTESCPMLVNPGQAIRPGTIGVALPGVRAKIVDDTGRSVPTGETGELVVQSPANFVGYWNNPAETAAALRDGWLATGDLARCDTEGYYHFQGRKKQLIVRDGYNISPQEVEEALYKHPAVLIAGVIGLPDPLQGQKVIAFISLRPGKNVSERDLRRFAQAHLNELKVPEQIFFLEALPLGMSGKVDRRALREKAEITTSA